jgi:hypothetical protein
MPISAEILKSLIEDELTTLSDARVIAHIRKALVEPYTVLCNWDYGKPGQQYPCWMVFKDARSGTEMAYCDHGFGPRNPWGLLSFRCEGGQRHMGMDTSWLTTFLDAFFESTACCELPIWRVFSVEPEGRRVPLSDESTWEATWSNIDDLRDRTPAIRYECGHSIKYGH